MTSTAIKTTLFALLVLSITVPSTVFATTHDLTGENVTSTDKVEMNNSTDNDTHLPQIIPHESNFESWENIRGEMVSVFSASVEKLQERGYLVTSS